MAPRRVNYEDHADAPTAPERNALGQFLQGFSGHPEGRRRGSRNKLGEAFIEALYRDFQEHGAEALAECRVTSPSNYCRLVASLLPRDVQLEASNDFDALSDDELRTLVADAIEQLADDFE